MTGRVRPGYRPLRGKHNIPIMQVLMQTGRGWFVQKLGAQQQ
jgi:hypothetical protein